MRQSGRGGRVKLAREALAIANRLAELTPDEAPGYLYQATALHGLDRPKDAKTLHRERRERDRQLAREVDQKDRQADLNKTRRIARRGELQNFWNGMSKPEQEQIETAAYEDQNSEALRRLFRTSNSHRLRECFRQLDRETKPLDSVANT